MEKKEFQVKWFLVTGVGMVATVVGGKKVLSDKTFRGVVAMSIEILKEWLLPVASC